MRRSKAKRMGPETMHMHMAPLAICPQFRTSLEIGMEGSINGQWGPCQINWMPQNLQKDRPIGLVQAGAIDRVVFRHHRPNDRADDASPSKSNSGTDPVCSRKVDDMAGRQGDCGPSAGTQP